MLHLCVDLINPLMQHGLILSYLELGNGDLKLAELVLRVLRQQAGPKDRMRLGLCHDGRVQRERVSVG